MKLYKYGNPESDIVLIEPVGDHNLNEIPNQVERIKTNTKKEIQMLAIKVDNWNQELSPWKAPAVFGKEAFGDGALNLLTEILKLCSDKNKKYYLGGYSLAGLFSFWACCQSDKFAGIAAASPSVWFPGFLTYLEENEVKNTSKLKDELMKKLENEYSEFKEQFMSLSPKEAVDNAYELVVKQEILDSFNYDMSYDKEKLQALLKQDNLLSQAYDEWLSTDGNLREALQYSVDNVVEMAVEDGKELKLSNKDKVKINTR